jgi:hypothetical protein
MGQFVGFSDKHSSLMANVRHLSTNFILPQFHVVFDVMNLLLSLSAKISFNLIGNFMQKRNLTKLAILFTSPLPSMRSGLMKLDDDKVTRIAYNRGIGTMTSCVIAIKQSNSLFLLL